jgi:trimeric autotransporter adhesin
VAHTWCPTGTTATAAGASPASVTAFYPQGDSVSAVTDTLAATTDGHHILGAALGAGGITFSDIGVTIPTEETTIAGNPTPIYTPVPCGTTGSTLDPLLITHTLNQAQIAANATAVNQVVTSPPPTLVNGSTSQAPSFAFITYSGATPNATLPYYVPSSTSGALGTIGYVTLKGASAITAPIAGTFSPDNTLFFVSTAGDNKIHYISIPTAVGAVPTDTQQFSPNLPACVPTSASDPYCTNTTVPAGEYVPATAIAVKPRSTT